MLKSESDYYLIVLVHVCVYTVTLIMMCGVLESSSNDDIISTVNHSQHSMTSNNESYLQMITYPETISVNIKHYFKRCNVSSVLFLRHLEASDDYYIDLSH